MLYEMIEYKSSLKSITYHTDILDQNTTDGVYCVWRGNLTNDSAVFSWIFNWAKLKNEGVHGLSGFIIVTPSATNAFSQLQIDVDLTETNQVIEKEITIPRGNNIQTYVSFQYRLIPYGILTQVVSYDKLFLPCDQNDAILVVEENKLHVSKAFLSYHSDYFRALFSSNYKEGQMDEIPIPEISYQDFGLLLSTIYPINVFPNDKTVEKLLELADRFIMPSVTHKVEHHLLNHTKIECEKMMWMADKYRMSKLLEKTINQMDSLEKMKKLEKSERFSELSNDANVKLFKRILKMI